MDKTTFDVGGQCLEESLFGDESKIELTPNRREYIRRRSGQTHNPRYTTKTVKFSAQSIIVLSYIKGNGERKLVKIDGILNSQK